MRYLPYIGMMLALTFSACQKEEIPVEYTPLNEVGGGDGPVATEVVDQIIYGDNYRNRIYYDIESSSIVSSHSKMDFDLAIGLDANTATWRIELNNSRLMRVFIDEENAFEDIQDVQGEGPFFDSPDALELVIDANRHDLVYIIDAGTDLQGESVGNYKLQILNAADDGEIVLQYARLGEEPQMVLVQPDPERNFLHLDFEEGVKTLEPNKEEWDILFTHYTRIFEDFQGFPDPIPYLVSGAMLNPYQTEGLKMEGRDFDALDRDVLDAEVWSTARDVIGFDWKTFDIATATYTLEDFSFGVRTAQGNTYKWRFLGFYDSEGNTGAPSFQAVLLAD